jgi:hypothetical protein
MNFTKLFFKPMATSKSVGPKNMAFIFSNIEQVFSTALEFLNKLLNIKDIQDIKSFTDIFLSEAR